MGTKWRITQNPIFTFFGRTIHVPHCTDKREEREWRQEVVQMSSLNFWFYQKNFLIPFYVFSDTFTLSLSNNLLRLRPLLSAPTSAPG